MNKKQGLFFCMVIFLSLIFTGCGGGNTKNSLGAVNGYVCAKGAKIQILSETNFPPGYSAVTGAKVTIDSDNATAITDATGAFTFNDVAPGDRVISVTLPNERATNKFVATVPAGGISPTEFIQYTGR